MRLIDRAKNETRRSRPETGDKHGAGVIGLLETTRLVKLEFVVISHKDDSQIVGIVLFHHLHKVAPNGLVLVFWADKQIVHVGCHDAIVHSANQPHEFVVVLRGEDSFKVSHSHNELVRKMPRRPLHGEEKVLQLLLVELVNIFVSNHRFSPTFLSALRL